MKRPGSLSLGDVAARATHLHVACTRCERHGRYNLQRLVATHGADFAMTDLGTKLADCTRRNLTSHGERCDVYFPGLVEIMGGVRETTVESTDDDDDY